MKRLSKILILGVIFLNITPTFAQKDTLRILGVGNSWTRDCIRWLSAIAVSADRPVIVGHGYLGGSTLEEQYLGINDTSYTYRHRDMDQVVHNTYQYWKYTCSETPVKTPASGYKNGLAGIGVTLQSVVQDEPWDIIVFQPHVVVKAHMPGYADFDINDLVKSIKGMMEPSVAAKVRCGLMIPFSYPAGNTDYRQRVVDAYNNSITPMDQHQWDIVYERMHEEIQKDAVSLARHMAENCSFTINVGDIIYKARLDKHLSNFGYKLQRAKNNTHLAEGMPMYIASLCYAYALLNIKPEDISFYPIDSTDKQLTGDRGNTKRSKAKSNASVAEYARKFVYENMKSE